MADLHPRPARFHRIVSVPSRFRDKTYPLDCPREVPGKADCGRGRRLLCAGGRRRARYGVSAVVGMSGVVTIGAVAAGSFFGAAVVVAAVDVGSGVPWG